VRARFADDAAVRLYHGDGAATLASLAPALRDRAALYWLDAHWCVADGTAGESSQCPLLRELSAIACLNSTSAILIDDARLFLSPPPHPHESADWPSFQDVLDALESLSGDHELMVLNDVIIWFPRTARAALVQHARRRGVDVLASVSRARSLEEELATVKEAADERLAAIGELTRIAEERLGAIEELTRVAEERLALIDQLTAAVHALQSNIGAHGSGDAPPASSGAGA
jgi:hypothetical protein